MILTVDALLPDPRTPTGTETAAAAMIERGRRRAARDGIGHPGAERAAEAHPADAAAMLRRLAGFQPRTLALLHGSAWKGDGATLLEALADRLHQRQ